MKVTEDTQKQTRKKILDASLKEFAAHGLEGARMRAIAKQAGVSLGVTYNYFKSKDDILKELLTKFYDDRVNIISKANPAKTGMADQIRAFIQDFIADLKKNDEYYRLYLSLLLQPQVMQTLKSSKQPFKDLDSRDQALFVQVGKVAQQELNIDGSVMLVFVMGLMVVHLTNERSIDIDQVTNQFIERLTA